jgi:cell division transport system permease protein
LRPDTYFVRHVQTLLFSLGRLCRTPGSTLMTIAVIGIALALPTGMQVLVGNVRSLSGAWHSVASISVFLKHGIDGASARRLGDKLRDERGVAAVRLITPAEALAEFRHQSGFGKALDLLQSNPLPAVLVVNPTPAFAEPAKTDALVQRLQALPEADRVTLDSQWLRRLHAMLGLVRRVVLVVAALLGLAVIIVVGNTIRMDIQNRRDEIEVCKLIGATNAFIRRPFLYSGVWYGVAGGLIACLLVALSLSLIAGPAASLAGLYGGQFRLTGLGFGGALSVIGAGALLGWLGSWLAVGRHLRAIEP